LGAGDDKRFNRDDTHAASLKLSKLDIEYDPFTRIALERQTNFRGCRSLEEYVVDAIMCSLEGDEEDCGINPRTGELYELAQRYGSFCNHEPPSGAKILDIEALA
jgi:hypothetical protein